MSVTRSCKRTTPKLHCSTNGVRGKVENASRTLRRSCKRTTPLVPPQLSDLESACCCVVQTWCTPSCSIRVCKSQERESLVCPILSPQRDEAYAQELPSQPNLMSQNAVGNTRTYHIHHSSSSSWNPVPRPNQIPRPP